MSDSPLLFHCLQISELFCASQKSDGLVRNQSMVTLCSVLPSRKLKLMQQTLNMKQFKINFVHILCILGNVCSYTDPEDRKWSKTRSYTV